MSLGGSPGPPHARSAPVPYLIFPKQRPPGTPPHCSASQSPAARIHAHLLPGSCRPALHAGSRLRAAPSPQSGPLPSPSFPCIASQPSPPYGILPHSIQTVLFNLRPKHVRPSGPRTPLWPVTQFLCGPGYLCQCLSGRFPGHLVQTRILTRQVWGGAQDSVLPAPPRHCSRHRAPLSSRALCFFPLSESALTLHPPPAQVQRDRPVKVADKLHAADSS